ncbi:MAG: ABC transporter ATP-binding protein, partial [Cyanobacteriota bacterium]|nr:ABC transporter ATP-binding protein [Cyanobacteriota bacterium]
LETDLSPGGKLFWLISGIIFLSFTVDTLKTINALITGTVRDQVRGQVNFAILQKIADFPQLSLFENTERLNLIKLAEKGLKRIEELAFITITGLNGFFTVIPAILFSLTIQWWVPLILFGTAFPSICIEIYFREKSWSIEQSQASANRLMDIQANILTTDSYAKEVRLLNLQSLILRRWRNYFNITFRSLQKIRKQGTFWIIASSFLNSLGIMIPYFYLVKSALVDKAYTIGDLALYGGLIIQVRQGLYILINNASDLYDVILGTTPIHQLLDLEIPPRPHPFVLPSAPAPSLNLGVEFRDVTFRYDGNEANILDGLSFQIEPGQTVALVGENGSGKSTLIKLLCRFYEPSAGEILWDGAAINQIDYGDLYARVAVIFQDYAQFPATLRENLAFGNLALIADDPALLSLLQTVGLALKPRSFPLGLETPIGRELENGVELSSGQWQRLAIARALARLQTCELLILDEPSAALDACAESQLINLLKSATQNRMALIVSHRLSLCRHVDKVIVLDKGRVLETGSHEELLAQRGHYYDVFNLQANLYLS